MMCVTIAIRTNYGVFNHSNLNQHMVCSTIVINTKYVNQTKHGV